jgi:hypothetical protein
VHGGGVEAGRPRAPEQDCGLGRGGGQIQADQAAAPLERPHVLQGCTVIGAAVKGINDLEVPEASPLQQVEDWHRRGTHLSDHLPGLGRQEFEDELVPGKEGIDEFFIRAA